MFVAKSHLISAEKKIISDSNVKAEKIKRIVINVTKKCNIVIFTVDTIFLHVYVLFLCISNELKILLGDIR